MLSTLTGYLEKHNLLIIILLIITTFAITYYSPIRYTDSDPFGTFLTSQAILEHGTIKLDAYSEVLPVYGSKIIRAENNHYYYYSALGTPILTTPFVWLANLRGIELARLTSPYQDNSQSALQNLLSAITVTISCILIFAFCRCYFNHVYSFFFTVAFVFGSSIVSTMGTALWNVNLEVVFILCALVILACEDQKKTKDLKPILLGLLLFFAYFCRPTAALFILTTLAYVFLKNRRTFIKMAVTLTFLFGLLVLFSMVEFNQFLPDYYKAGFLDNPISKSAVYGSLLSPSRGLLVFSPYLFLPFIGLILYGKQLYKEPFVWFGVIWFALYVMMISRWPNWWGGHSFGPRLLTDALPALFIITVLVWKKALMNPSQWQKVILATSFVVLAFSGIFINTKQGLYNNSSAKWSWVTDIDHAPQYLFNWKYPQFLANPEMFMALEAERKSNNLNTYKPGQKILPHSKKVVYLGWHSPEENNTFRWSDGKSPKILLKVHPRDYIGINSLIIKIKAGTYQPQRINVLVNGVEVGVIESQEIWWNPSTYTFPIKRSLLGLDDTSSHEKKLVEIEFLIPNAMSPAVIEPQSNLDTRVLGIALYKLIIIPEE